MQAPHLPHIVARQRLDVAVASREAAHALIERLSDLNRRRWLPLIERIFDEFDSPGKIIRIDRLNIDLGQFGERELGQAEARLDAALREALREAIGARRATSIAMPEDAATITIGTALIAALDHYLLHGVWPYGGALDAGTAPAIILDSLIDSDPVALVAMLRRHHGSEIVLRRLVRQMPVAILERLLAKLDPDNADYIIAYFADVREAHAARPVADIAPAEIDQVLWTLALRDALHRAGLRANRKAFVAAMLGDLARASGVPIADVFAELHTGLGQIRGGRAPPGSLLTIISEIIAENSGMPSPNPVLFRAAAEPDTGRSPGGVDAAPLEHLALLLAMAAPDTASLADAIDRALAADRCATRALLRDHARAGAGRVLAHLEAAMPAGSITVLLMPEAIAEQWRHLLAAAGCTPAERAALLALAAATSPSAPPAVFTRAAVARLARIRHLRPRALRDRIVTAPPLAARNGAAVRREAALALIATLVDRTSPFDATERAAALRHAVRSLSGMSADVVRARIGSLAADRAGTPRMLEAADRSTLSRLLLLLVPADERRVLRDRITGGETLSALVLGYLGKWPSQSARPGSWRRVTGAAAAGDPRAMAALLRHRPMTAIATIGAWPTADTMMRDAGAAAILFAGFAPGERLLATTLGILLSGNSGRAAIVPAKAIEALALTLSSRDWRGGAEGFAAAWLATTMRLASLSEQAAVRALVERRWPAGQNSPAGNPFAAALKLPSAATTKAASAPGTKLLQPGSLAWADALLREQPVPAMLRLRRALRDPAIRAVLARRLPEAMLARLFALAAPLVADDALRVAGQAAAVRSLAGTGLTREAFWQAILTFATEPNADFARLLSLTLDDLPKASRLPIETTLIANATGYRDRALRAALDHRRYTAPSSPAKDVSSTPADAPDDILVGNAGIVLASSFLPRFFSVLELTELDRSGTPRWRSPETQGRAVHLVQMLVDDRPDAPEPMLALNKLLCGMPIAAPVIAAIDPTEEERATCRLLLDTMIGHWPQMRGSSHAALRETFFQRKGRIGLGENGITVTIERKVVDILLGSLGWSYSMILHPWMREAIHVRW